jgi:hypothetical protein
MSRPDRPSSGDRLIRSYPTISLIVSMTTRRRPYASSFRLWLSRAFVEAGWDALGHRYDPPPNWPPPPPGWCLPKLSSESVGASTSTRPATVDSRWPRRLIGRRLWLGQGFHLCWIGWRPFALSGARVVGTLASDSQEVLRCSAN